MGRSGQERGRSLLLSKSLIATLIIALVTSVPSAPASASDYSGAFLLNRPGTRQAALSSTGVVAARGAEGLFWNPASLGLVNNAHLNADYSPLPFDMSRASATIKFADTWPWSFGAGINYLNYGEIPLRTESGDANGVVTPLAIEIGAGLSFQMTEDLHLGVNAKYVSEELIERSNTMAVGAGVAYQLDRLSLSLSTDNHFGELWGFSLPVTHRFGIGYSAIANQLDLFTAANLISSDELTLGFGLEFNYGGLASLRAGYSTPNLKSNELETSNGLNLGAMIKAGKFGVDYAYAITDDIESIHSFSLSYSLLGRPRKTVDWVARDTLTPVALLAFEDRSSDSAQAWIAQSLMDILQTELSNSKYFRFAPVDLSSTSTNSTLEYLERKGISLYVTGSCTRASNNFRLSAQLHSTEVDGALRGLVKDGSISELWSKATELARDIDWNLYMEIAPEDSLLSYRSPLDLSGEEAQLLVLSDITSRSQIIPAETPLRTSEPLLSFRMTNRSGKTLQRVSVGANLSDIATVGQSIEIGNLEADSSIFFELTTPLDMNVLWSVLEQTNVNVSVAVKGVHDRREFSVNRIFPFVLLTRNHIDWTRPMSLASFIQSDVVRSLAPDFLRAPDTLAHLGNLAQIIKICSFYSSANIGYISDPLPQNFHESRLDRVKCPEETLSSQAGDCDDQSVLLASLLHGAGLEANIAISTDHVFCLVNTGLHTKFRDYITIDSADLVAADGCLWIPIECTALDRGFMEAWSAGAERMRAYGRNLEILDVSDALNSYPGLPRADIAGDDLHLPSSEQVYRTYFEDLSTFESSQQLERRSAIARLESAESSPGGRVNDLAYWLTLEDKLTEAEAQLLSQLQHSDPDSRLLNNLGNCALLQGNTESAVDYYYQAISADSQDVSPLINLALVFESIGDDSAAIAAFEQVLNYVTEDELYQMLGLHAERFNYRRDSERAEVKSPPKEVVQYHVETALENRALAPSKKAITRVPDESQRDRQRRRIRSAGRRGLPGSEQLRLLDYLVWSRGSADSAALPGF